MPTYEFHCMKCKKSFDEFRTMSRRDVPAKCVCGTLAQRNPIVSFHAEIWNPITLEHIADEPMTFTSKKQLSRYCNEHNLLSGALL